MGSDSFISGSGPAPDPRPLGDPAEAPNAQLQLGARIRRLRKERGLSQRVLAGDDLSPSYVSLLESGQRNPTDDVLRILADRLQTTPAELTGNSELATPASVETQLELRWARIALYNGDATDALAPLRRLLDNEELGPVERSEAQLLLATAHELNGQLFEAVDLLEQVGPRLTEDAERWTAAQTQLCRCYKEIGDLDRAIDVGEAVNRRLGDQELTDSAAVLATTLGGAYYERGDLARAAHVLSRVLQQTERLGSHRARGGALWNSSLVAAAENRLNEALMLAERALAILGESDNTRNLARLKVAYAWLQLETGGDDVEATRRLLLHAQIDLQVEGSAVDLAACLTELARCDLLIGDFEAARRTATSAIDLLRHAPTIEGARAHAILGQGLILSGDVGHGAAAMRAAAFQLQDMAARREAARVWRDLAELAAHAGETTLATEAMEAAAAALGIVPRSVRALLRRHDASNEEQEADSSRH